MNERASEQHSDKLYPTLGSFSHLYSREAGRTDPALTWHCSGTSLSMPSRQAGGNWLLIMVPGTGVAPLIPGKLFLL